MPNTNLMLNYRTGLADTSLAAILTTIPNAEQLLNKFHVILEQQGVTQINKLDTLIITELYADAKFATSSGFYSFRVMYNTNVGVTVLFIDVTHSVVLDQFVLPNS